MTMETLKLTLSNFFKSSGFKYGLACFVYGLLCFFGSLLFVQCSSEKAQKEVQDATVRAEKAEATVYTLKDENTRLRETMTRANDAVERALTLILEAQDSHEERMEKIESDPAAADWLTCELPNGVREAFADYYRH